MFPFELKSELYLDITLQYLHTYTNTLGSVALTWARGQDWTADLWLTDLYPVDSDSLTLSPRNHSHVSHESLVLTLSGWEEKKNATK